MNTVKGESEELRDKFREQGYVVIDSQLDHSVLDACKNDLEKFFGPDREDPVHVPSSEANRIQDAWYINQDVRKIAECPVVLQTLEELYGVRMRPFQTLNFRVGTQQPIHADSIHFNSVPFGGMCGVWVALEDIGPDQGPLKYYPKSQNLPEMNYPDLGLQASPKSYPQYLSILQDLIEEHGFEPEYGLIKKGQALIWCANILHGGAKQNDMSLTRYSQVTHYYQENIRYWRPSQSNRKQRFFKPDWVRDVTGEEPKYPLKPPAPTIGNFLRRVKGKIKRDVFGDYS